MTIHRCIKNKKGIEFVRGQLVEVKFPSYGSRFLWASRNADEDSLTMVPPGSIVIFLESGKREDGGILKYTDKDVRVIYKTFVGWVRGWVFAVEPGIGK